jgi:hypothetical protein
MTGGTPTKRIESAGTILVTAFHLVALFVIGGSIVWSAVVSYLEIKRKTRFTRDRSPRGNGLALRPDQSTQCV